VEHLIQLHANVIVIQHINILDSFVVLVPNQLFVLVMEPICRHWEFKFVSVSALVHGLEHTVRLVL